MKTVQAMFHHTIEIKRSKFTAFLIPIDLYEEEMSRLRAHHSKAVHFVSAYRYLNKFDQIVEYAGDDGEPKGTSGKPTLSVLQGHELINTAVITVRYFGGTKLGSGGLVRAYAQAANAAYATAVLYPYEKLLVQTIGCDYSIVSIVEHECTQQSIRIITKDFTAEGATFSLEGTLQKLDTFYAKMGRAIDHFRL